MESSRAATIAAHLARHEAYLKQREENKERRRRDALRRIAPGFEPQSGLLVPTRLSDRGSAKSMSTSEAEGAVHGEGGSDTLGPGLARQRNVMDDLVDHLAALDAAGRSTTGSKDTD